MPSLSRPSPLKSSPQSALPSPLMSSVVSNTLSPSKSSPGSKTPLPLRSSPTSQKPSLSKFSLCRSSVPSLSRFSLTTSKKPSLSKFSLTTSNEPSLSRFSLTASSDASSSKSSSISVVAVIDPCPGKPGLGTKSAATGTWACRVKEKKENRGKYKIPSLPMCDVVVLFFIVVIVRIPRPKWSRENVVIVLIGGNLVYSYDSVSRNTKLKSSLFIKKSNFFGRTLPSYL